MISGQFTTNFLNLDTFKNCFNSASFRIEVTLILFFHSKSTNWTEIMPRIDRVEGEER